MDTYGTMTWEDPHHVDVNTGQIGDNDPIDVCEIGFKVFQRGEVVQVKVLGIIALIDEGETDWKVLAINVKDPLAENLNDICDVEKHMPGFLAMTRDWFRIYKMPTGKPANQFAFDGKPKDKKFALDIVRQTHEQWRQLVMKKTDGSSLVCENTTIKDSPFIIKQDAAKAIVDTNPISTAASAIPTEVDKWHFVK
jgi:inorganic pyrophosphatase